MTTDFRDAVFLAVHEVMDRDPRAMVLYNDMGALELDRIRRAYPSRVCNVGISEQNMASLAAGLAFDGRCVFTYGIIAHVFARSFEQIRNDICCANLPVIILGVGSGLSYGADGPTHHAVQDIAVMRTLPNMAVYNPADCVTAQAAVREAATRNGPGFIRMDKEQVPPLYMEGADFAQGFSILRHGTDVALVSSGVLTHKALDAAQRLVTHGINVRVIDVYRFKPLDLGAVRDALAGVRAVVTAEENSLIGGLGSLIGELLSRGNEHPSFTSIGLADEPLIGSASRGWAENRFGYSVEALVDALRHAAQPAASHSEA